LKIAVIGGSGHIGAWLSPRLAEAGHEVLCVSRGLRRPYVPHEAWRAIERIALDRTAEEARGTFGSRIASLGAEAVIDITCYTPESARHLADALRGRVAHFLHCGTIWVHGHAAERPISEDATRSPFGDYGCRKAAIEDYLLNQSGLPATVIHPGHLVGPGWNPINPAGNFNPQVFDDLAAGREVLLPNLGMETLHHVHAADVAQVFALAVENRAAAVGQAFHAVSPAALTLRGYAEAMARWFGREPNLRFLPFGEWREHFSERDAAVTLDHLLHSTNCSIEKAKSLLGYKPRYSSLEAVQESIDSGRPSAA
jgi:nucleoside-diphosphate-sugar epimerase